nr:HK97-gp10 family putative phage morphogenesis protein [uncultured Pseudomonas sp.]
MADTIEFSLIGLDNLLGKLDSVKQDVKVRGGRFALRKAAQLIADKARENWHRVDDEETARSIADNIALRWNGRLFKQTGDLAFRIGVLHGAVLRNGADTSTNAPTPHWRLIEFGTEKMQAQPLMRSALADNIAAATDTFIAEYEKAIDRAVRRADRKGR